MGKQAIQISRAVLERQERYSQESSEVGAFALTQAWKYLVDTPLRISTSLSVKMMSCLVVVAAEAIHSIYQIAGGKLPFAATDIGQRAIGHFSIPSKYGGEFHIRWGEVDDKFVWVAHKDGERVAEASTLTELVKELPDESSNRDQ